MNACHNLGILYDNGYGVKQDPSKALHIWEKSCAGGMKYSCHSIAASYRQGLGGYKKDIQKARKYYQRACDLGHDRSCFVLSNPYFGKD